MRIGIVNEDIWDFFTEILQDLQSHYLVKVFEPPGSRFLDFAPSQRLKRRWRRRALRRFMQSHDVVFFEWAGDLLAEASRLPKSCGIVARVHRYDLYEWADRVDWSRVDTLILVSRAKRAEFARRFPEHAHRVAVIPEAVSLDRFRYQPKPFAGRIGTLCHLTPRKRVYDLILTFYELSRKMPDLTLRIGGDVRPRFRDYDEALRRLVVELELQRRVTFDGLVTEPESWYRNIDIFVSNSYSEGLQVAPIEAAAAGCYCLSHRWDGADELLPQENLFYSSSELQQRITAYCESTPEERRRRLEGLRQIITEQFDVAVTAGRIRALIEQARLQVRGDDEKVQAVSQI